MNKDLTVGKPKTVLWKFCLPLFGSIIFQQLYNIADSLVAGKFIGENALAAVGNSYEITLIFIAFAFGCNMGCSVIVSQLFGAKKYERLKTAVSTACIFSAFLCAALMLAGILGCSLLLDLMQTPAEVFSDSKLYLDIYIWGLPFVFFYNIATGIFSALGDSKTPFCFLAASSTSNIAVDILFVKAFHMGVAGVAWATFLCQGISCILAVLTVWMRLKKIQVKKKAAPVRLGAFKKDPDNRCPKYFAAEFYFHGEYPDPERYQWIWAIRHGWLFRRSETEQSGYYLIHHNRQWNFQFFGAEPWCP